MRKKEIKENIVTNLDGSAICNRSEAKWLMKLDEKQQKALLYSIENDFPVESFAYSGVNANRMKAIYDVYLDFNLNTLCDRIDIWKLVHTKLTNEQFIFALFSLVFGVRILDEVVDAPKYEEDIFRTIYNGAKKGINLCQYVGQVSTCDELAFILQNLGGGYVNEPHNLAPSWEEYQF